MGRFLASKLLVRKILHTFALANIVTIRYICMKSHCPNFETSLQPRPSPNAGAFYFE